MTTGVPIDVVRADFDRIGVLTAGDGLDRTNRIALGCVRRQPTSILEIGCGTGALSAELARRSPRLVAIDASSVMVRLTQERCPSTEVIEADFMTWSSSEPFELVITVAMLHHLPLDAGIARLASFVAPGGQLIVVDVFEAGVIYSAFNVALRLLRPGRRDPMRAAAYEEHAKHERMPALAEVRAACRRVLPNAVIRRHLEWRYSLVHTRPR